MVNDGDHSLDHSVRIKADGPPIRTYHRTSSTMAPSDFADANIDEIMDSLTTDEAISLTAGVGFWHTHAIERLKIPPVKVLSLSLFFFVSVRSTSQIQVSDGPNGIRGGHFFMGTPAKCLPVCPFLPLTYSEISSVPRGAVCHGAGCHLGHQTHRASRLETYGKGSKAESCISHPRTYRQHPARAYVLFYVGNYEFTRSQSPLGGRVRQSIVFSKLKLTLFLIFSQSFESFSEDPTLSGLIASAYVKGIQSGGIGTTMKHFVYALFFL